MFLSKQYTIKIAATLFLVLQTFFLSSYSAHAASAFTKTINYQGKLSSSNNQLVPNGTYTIQFNLYNVSTGGSSLWNETRSVVITNGLFSEMLGTTTSLSSVNFNQPLYLGVKVGTDPEMSPRKPLGVVPAAMEADKLDGLDSTDFVLPSRTVATGNGLLGGGDLTANRTLSINAPACLTSERLSWSGTAFSCVAVTSGTLTSITAGTGLTGGTITTSGTIGLSNTGVSAATYGSTTTVPTITIDAQGRITSASNTAISFPVTGATNGLSLFGTDTGLGGTLIQDTFIDNGGFNLGIGSSNSFSGNNIFQLGNSQTTNNTSESISQGFTNQMYDMVRSFVIGSDNYADRSNSFFAIGNANNISRASDESFVFGIKNNINETSNSYFLGRDNNFTGGTNSTNYVIGYNNTNTDSSSNNVIIGNNTTLQNNVSRSFSFGSTNMLSKDGDILLGNNLVGDYSDTVHLGTDNNTKVTIENSGATTIRGNFFANANTQIGDSISDRITFNSQLLGTTPLVFQGSTDDVNTTSFEFIEPTSPNTIYVPDATGTMLLDTTLGQIGFVQGGNSFGAPANFGTNDNNILNFKTNGSTRFTLANNASTLTGNSATSLIGGTTLALDSTGTNAITIGTGANAKTVTIGNITGTTALNFNSGTGIQSFNSNAATTDAFIFNADNITSGSGLSVRGNNLTTGTLLNVVSSYGAGNSTNGMFVVANSGSGTSGKILRAQSNSTAGSGLTVLASGNVGVGTDAPSTLFNVYSPITSKNVLRANVNSTMALDQAMVTVGHGSTNKPEGLARDQLYVFGRINSSWNMVQEDFLGAYSVLTADAPFGNLYWDESTGSAATISAVSSAGISGVARLSFVTPAINTSSLIGSNGTNVTQRSLNPVYEARILGTNATNQRIVAGFLDPASGAAITTDTYGTNGAFFRKTAAGTTWQTVTKNAGTETVTATALATNVWQTLRVEINDTAGNVKFFINGTLVATHTLNLPASTTPLGHYIGNGISTAVNANLDIDYVRVWSDDPDTDLADNSSLVDDITQENQAVVDQEDENVAPSDILTLSDETKGLVKENETFVENLFGQVGVMLNKYFEQTKYIITKAFLYVNELFAKKVHTEELCLKKADGSEYCVTGDQLERAMLNGSVFTTPTSGNNPPDQGVDVGSSSENQTDIDQGSGVGSDAGDTANNGDAGDLITNSDETSSTDTSPGSPDSVNDSSSSGETGTTLTE